jgi:hypothetical protein
MVQSQSVRPDSLSCFWLVAVVQEEHPSAEAEELVGLSTLKAPTSQPVLQRLSLVLED